MRKLFSRRMISWLWRAVSSFMKFWNFWISLTGERITFPARHDGCASARRIPAWSSAWERPVRFPACSAVGWTSCGSCYCASATTSSFIFARYLGSAFGSCEPRRTPKHGLAALPPAEGWLSHCSIFYWLEWTHLRPKQTHPPLVCAFIRFSFQSSRPQFGTPWICRPSSC